MASHNEIRVLLEKKRGLLSLIGEVTLKQTELIDQTLTDELLNNIQQRQQLIDQVDEIDKELPKKDELRRDPEFAHILNEIQEILFRIINQDKANEELAIIRRDELQKEIRQTSAGIKAASAYNRPGHTLSAHFNQNK